MKRHVFVFTACPDHCSLCTWNSDMGRTECNANVNCDDGYGLRTSDKQCPGGFYRRALRVLLARLG